MKQRKKIWLGICAVLMALVLCVACSSKMSGRGEAMMDSAPGESANKSETETTNKDDVLLEGKTPGAVSDSSDRKIIMRYSYRLETKDLDESVARLKQAVEAGGGYVSNVEISGNSKDGGYASLTLRVPTEQIGDFEKIVQEAGNITSQAHTSEDVSGAYYDSESRLKALRIQEERLLELLEQADGLESLLLLEDRLTEVRTEIESLTGTLNRYDHLIEYTTVSVWVRQVQTYTEPAKTTFWGRAGEAFVETFANAWEVLQNLCIAVIWLIPYLLVGSATVVILVAVIRKNASKKKVQTEASEQNENTEMKS